MEPMYIPIEAEGPTRSDRRISWAVGGIVAAIFLGLIVMSLGQSDPDPTPPPPVKRVAAPLTPSQETYLVYANWLQSANFASCMGERGFAREAVAGTGQIHSAAVAAFLGISPRKPESWLAPAEARNGRPASDPTRAAELNRALDDVSDGGCQHLSGDVDIHDDAAVSAAVRQARGDASFASYLAEGAWLAENPDSALLYKSHLMIALVDPSAPRASDRWAPQLSKAMAVVTREQGWSEGPSEGYADFAQAVAIADDGSMVLVRVGDPAVDREWVHLRYRHANDRLRRRGRGVGNGVVLPADANTAEPYTALATGVCDAMK